MQGDAGSVDGRGPAVRADIAAVLRWALLLPVTLVAGWAPMVLVAWILEWSPGWTGSAPGGAIALLRAVVRIAGATGATFLFVYVGARVAPEARRLVARMLVGLVVLAAAYGLYGAFAFRSIWSFVEPLAMSAGACLALWMVGKQQDGAASERDGRPSGGTEAA